MCYYTRLPIKPKNLPRKVIVRLNPSQQISGVSVSHCFKCKTQITENLGTCGPFFQSMVD